MSDYNVTYRNTGSEALSVVLIVFLILFFPIGVIVLIVRTISKVKRDRIEGIETKARAEHIAAETNLLHSDILERYKNLLEKGIISQAEFNAKKNQILYKAKFNNRAIKREQKLLELPKSESYKLETNAK